MSQYKLVTYQSPQGPRAGLVVGETVFDVAAATGRPSYVTMLDVLRDWDTARGLLAGRRRRGRRKERRPSARGTKLLTPVPTPARHFLRRRELHRPHDGNGQGAKPHAGARPAQRRAQALAFHQGACTAWQLPTAR